MPSGAGTMEEVRVPGFLETQRTDAWWAGPVAVAIGFVAFIVYATWAALTGKDYLYEGGGADYLSPFYSPLLRFPWWPFSPAILILWAPVGFRATCYYYRKAYYRALFGSPPGCAVGSVTGARYKGEAKGPLTVMNLHRYFLYLAMVLMVILWYDAIRAFFFRSPQGDLRLGVGVGSLVLLVNIVLISGFTLGCNSLRHLAGGNVDCFSCPTRNRTRYRAWRFVTLFNERHMLWAWLSLVSVGLADLYVRLLATGVIPAGFDRLI